MWCFHKACGGVPAVSFSVLFPIPAPLVENSATAQATLSQQSTKGQQEKKARPAPHPLPSTVGVPASNGAAWGSCAALVEQPGSEVEMSSEAGEEAQAPWPPPVFLSRKGDLSLFPAEGARSTSCLGEHGG